MPILLYVWLDFANQVQQPFDHALSGITPWFERIAQRDSAEKSKQLLNQVI